MFEGDTIILVVIGLFAVLSFFFLATGIFFFFRSRK
jgi:hypothetical protein